MEKITLLSKSKQFFSFQNQNGFTLVELIVVILLIGILSVSIAPRFFTVGSYEDRRAVDELFIALRYAQQMAMNRGGNIQLVISANQFRVERLVPPTYTPADLRSPEGNIPYKKTFPSGITASPAITIIYDGLGKPNAGYTINIGSKQIKIEAETGYAHQI